MALLIPETLDTLPNAHRRHLAKALRELADDYSVRIPFSIPDVFDLVVTKTGGTWLGLAFVETAEEVKEKAKALFGEVKTWSQRCTEATGDLAQLELLIVVLKAKGSEPKAKSWSEIRLRVVSKPYFLDNTAALLDDSKPLPLAGFDWLFHEFFPEREVPAACTTRTVIDRDNLAQLSRFFLDYDQELAAKLDLLKPDSDSGDLSVRLINGVAGSGKTLIIVSRILMYCQQYPDNKVLLLIHNKPVTADIRYRINKYWGGEPPNLTIKTFWSWCRGQWDEAFGKGYLKLLFNTDKTVGGYIKDQQERYGVGKRLTANQIRDEIEFLNDNFISDETAYLDANRAGRGFALRVEERAELWQLRNEVVTKFGEKTGLLSSLMPNRLCSASAIEKLERYDHIIVDEAQFFAPSWFELVKSSLLPSGSLFLCADPNQGFLKSRLSWKSAGINVRGRTKRLHKSYRTTQQILHAANSFLSEFAPELDEDYLKPEYEGMSQGVKPILLYKQSPQDALEQLTNEVNDLIASGRPPGQILVLYTSGVYPSTVQQRLETVVAADEIWNFSTKNGDKAPLTDKPGFLKIAKLEAATGLEAGVVFILGVDQLFSEYESLDLNEEERTEKRQECARKLYMGMTRAGQRLVMFSTTKLPDALEQCVEVKGTPGL